MADDSSRFAELVAQVAGAYFSNSHVAVADIPKVMRSIAEGLADSAPGRVGGGFHPQTPIALAAAAEDADDGRPRRASAAQIRNSVRPEHLVSFEDGKPYKMLRLHLKMRGLSPEDYRRKWGLPADYPMTAANHSATRAAIAKRIGFGGRKPRRGNGRRKPAS